MQAVQATLEEGVPLSEVTFCVVDLETTGGSPNSSSITEIGAVKYRGGERLGTFQTLVDPGSSIPPFITHLTGIDDATVAGAPSIEAALPGLVEFLRGAIFVAHNAQFDFGFVNAALASHGYDPIPPPPVCTARLARRVVWPDVPNVRLHTLARYFRCASQPAHRALADAEACAEVLHGLLGLGGRLGILTLGDLRHAIRARGRPNFAKIRLTDRLPRSPGVYMFRNKAGQVLYVGKANDLRGRVKTYFYGDGRKKVEDLLSEMTSVDGIPCTTELEALVLEARLIREHEPKYNRRGRTWRRYTYLKIDTAEAYPRIKIVHEVRGEGEFLGPFPSSSQAGMAKDALEEAFPIRRCTRPMRPSTRFSPCALADLGRCLAPCDGRARAGAYPRTVESLLASLSSPAEMLAGLEHRMMDLAAAGRYEEAAVRRDRLRVLADALSRRRTDRWLVGSGRLVLREASGNALRFLGAALINGHQPDPIALPCSRERADELSAVRGWLVRNPVVVEDAESPPVELVAGGAELHRIRSLLREADRPLPSSRR